jgi:hypothetical protein
LTYSDYITKNMYSPVRFFFDIKAAGCYRISKICGFFCFGFFGRNEPKHSYFNLFLRRIIMSKKLYFLISLVLVLALVVPASAEETLLAGYEQSEAAAGLKVGIDDTAANPTAKAVWPMVQGKDACSYDPNFGRGVIIPKATNGNSVLGVYWKNEEDGRVDIHNEWAAPVNIGKDDKILIDVYIVGPNGVPSTIELWDNDLAWLLGHHDPIVTGKWFTVTFDLAELQQDVGRLVTDARQFTTIYFSGVTTKDGKVFFDNLRLQRAPAPKPSSPKPPKKEPNDVNVGAKH